MGGGEWGGWVGGGEWGGWMGGGECVYISRQN